MNHRPPGYELLWAVQSVDFRRFLPIFIPGTFQIQDVIPSPLRRNFPVLGQNLGQDSDPTSEIAPDINKEMSYVPTLPLSAGIIQNFMVG